MGFGPVGTTEVAFGGADLRCRSAAVFETEGLGDDVD
jgi:hypothetical protein